MSKSFILSAIALILLFIFSDFTASAAAFKILGRTSNIDPWKVSQATLQPQSQDVVLVEGKNSKVLSGKTSFSFRGKTLVVIDLDALTIKTNSQRIGENRYTYTTSQPQKVYCLDWQERQENGDKFSLRLSISDDRVAVLVLKVSKSTNKPSSP